MTMFYSKVRNAFYPEHLQDDYRNSQEGWPDDAIAVGEGVYHHLIAGKASGKIIMPDEDGYPILAERPALTTEQLIALATEKKEMLLSAAEAAIAPLSRAVRLNMATDEEIKRLEKWERFSVLISRVDTTKPEWPEQPE